MAGDHELRPAAPELLVDDPVTAATAGYEADFLLMAPDPEEQSFVRAAPAFDHEAQGLVERDVAHHGRHYRVAMDAAPLTLCPALLDK